MNRRIRVVDVRNGIALVETESGMTGFVETTIFYNFLIGEEIEIPAGQITFENDLEKFKGMWAWFEEGHRLAA